MSTLATAATLPFTPKRVKLLTRPLMRFAEGVPLYVFMESAIYIGKEMKADTTEDKKKKEPAHLAEVIDLATGEQAQIIVSAVPLSVFEESYKDHSYIGKCFAITKLARQAGKQYFGFSVEEIEAPTPVIAKNGETARAAHAAKVAAAKEAEAAKAVTPAASPAPGAAPKK